MRLRNSASGYGAVAQSLHWLTVVLVAIAWALGSFDDVLLEAARRARLDCSFTSRPVRRFSPL